MATSTATRSRHPHAARATRARHARSAAGSSRSTTWFLVPALILFSLAITLPAIMGIFFSFTNSIGFGEWEFIGLINYTRCSATRRSGRATCSPSGSPRHGRRRSTCIAFLLAVGADSPDPAEDRAADDLRDPDGHLGHHHRLRLQLPVLELGAGAGHHRSASRGSSESILANPDCAWLAIVIVTAWQAIPGTLLIYIAGLLSIPGEVYEAADLDGASKTQAAAAASPSRSCRVRRDQRDPRLQGLPERVRHHHRPHRRRPGHVDLQHRDDDRHRVHRRRLRLPDGQRHHLLPHHDRSSPSLQLRITRGRNAL